MKKNVMNFLLDLIESQIEDWYEEENGCNEGAILDNEYERIKYLIWLLGEEINKKK